MNPQNFTLLHHQVLHYLRKVLDYTLQGLVQTLSIILDLNKLSFTWANCKSVKLPRTDTNASDLYNSEFLVKLAVTIFKLFYDMNFSKGTDIWEIIERSLSNLSRYHPYLTSYCVCFGMFWNFVWTVLLIKKTASQFPRKKQSSKRK